jgi:hypothetical protein
MLIECTLYKLQYRIDLYKNKKTRGVILPTICRTLQAKFKVLGMCVGRGNSMDNLNI